MTRRLIFVGLFLVLVAAVVWVATRKSPPPAAPPPAEVTIQDKATIDFSSGKPKVTSTAEDRAIMEKAAQEMEEAAKNVVFEPPPTAAQPAEKKAAPATTQTK